MRKIFSRKNGNFPGRDRWARAGLSLAAILGSAGLTGILLIYRTSWAPPGISGYLLIGLGIGVFGSVAGLIMLEARAWQRGRLLRLLGETLSAAADQPDADFAAALEPLPAQAQSPLLARGWNRLLARMIQAQQDLQLIRTESHLEEFLCQYDSQRLIALLNVLADGIILADAAGGILLANRASGGKLGRPQLEIAGNNLRELFRSESARLAIGKFLEQRVTRADCSFEIALANQPDAPGLREEAWDGQITPGTNLTILRALCQRLSPENENSDILLTLRDVTQQKIAEATQSDFIVHVSHELRSPLTNIRAYAETLLSDMVLDATAQKEAFNVINEETIRLGRLVNEVLDLARMETGALNLQAGPVVLERLIRQCLADVKNLAAGKNITLQTNYHPKLPEICADRDKLTVAINNILTNAIKYTPDGGTVFVETNVDDRLVYIKIADTGFGVSPSDLPRIFEKFYRVDRAETAGIVGSGLGLATAREVISLHGGNIRVKSELNKGTEMVIEIPLTTVGPVLGPSREKSAGRTEDGY